MYSSLKELADIIAARNDIPASDSLRSVRERVFMAAQKVVASQLVSHETAQYLIGT